MRTLLEIVNAAKDGSRPTYDECFYAMRALDYLQTFNDMDIQDGIEKASNLMSVYERVWDNSKKCYDADPRVYTGESLK